MKWTSFFTPVENLTPDQARTYMEERAEGSYTLLDVRQPGEYENGHIPGATLVPLPDLSDRIEELDKGKPVLAYCAVGGRSRAAAQYLAGRGFDRVFNLKGGIRAWDGLTAAGPEDEGMAWFRGDETLFTMLALAFGMEEGLAEFYRVVAGLREEPKVRALLERLAAVEDRHRERIWDRYRAHDTKGIDRDAFESGAELEVMEGGFTTKAFLDRHAAAMETVQGTLSIAMMLEAQALDLYSRYARKSEDPVTRGVLLEVADEEKQHLAALGRLLDEQEPT